MHCKIVQKSWSDFVPDFLYRKYGVESNAWFKCDFSNDCYKYDHKAKYSQWDKER